MSTTETVIQRSNVYAKAIMLGFIMVSMVIWLIYYTNWLVAFRVMIAYLLPVFLVIGIGLIIVLYREGSSNISFLSLSAGIVLVVGGTSLDLLITVIKSPSLAREGNPIARVFLDSGYPVEFVYVYGLIAQLLLMVFGCMLWIAFLRHRKVIIASCKNTNPKSFWELFKAATGGAYLTWRQYFLPVKISELPKAYYYVWMLAVLWLGGTIYHWYLGIEWLNIIRVNRYSVIIGSLLLTLVLYILWLWGEYRGSVKLSSSEENIV